MLISSASLDAEDSTATAAAAGNPQERSPWGRKHRSEQWRVKNCQAQKTFRLKQKAGQYCLTLLHWLNRL